MSYDAPFAGLKVVDLSQGIAGPYAAMLLAQYGADVIKVEPPAGDWSRTLGQRYGDHTAFSIAGNLGKRSIALDLKGAEGRTVLERLTRRADVFIEGFRPGVAARLGMAYPDVAALNPRVVYLSISGFGQAGPESARPAMDPVLQAFTGLISVNRGLDGVPHRVAAIPIDMTTALYSFQALAVALYARRRESRGCYIDASLMQSAAALQSVHLMAHYLEGGRMRPGLTPSGTFPASDGWIQLTIHHDTDFASLCAALEIPEVRDDLRFATDALRYENVAVLTPLLNAAFARRPTREWGERLRAAGIMHERVNDYLDFLRHPHVEATSAIAWIEQPGVGKVPIPNVPGLPPLVSGSRGARAPSLDEHRAEILAEIGHVARDRGPATSRSGRPGP